MNRFDRGQRSRSLSRLSPVWQSGVLFGLSSSVLFAFNATGLPLITADAVEQNCFAEQFSFTFDFFTQPFCDLDRIDICGGDTANHMITIKFREPVFKRATRAFGGVTFAPMFACECPT